MPAEVTARAATWPTMGVIASEWVTTAVECVSMTTAVEWVRVAASTTKPATAMMAVMAGTAVATAMVTSGGIDDDHNDAFLQTT